MATLHELYRAFPRLGRSLRILALGACVAVALPGCMAHARGEIVYDHEAEYVEAPPRIERYPSTYYRGEPAYLVEGRWYYRRGGSWVVFRDEPRELREYRTHRAPVRYSDYGRNRAEQRRLDERRAAERRAEQRRLEDRRADERRAEQRRRDERRREDERRAEQRRHEERAQQRLEERRAEERRADEQRRLEQRGKTEHRRDHRARPKRDRDEPREGNRRRDRDDDR
jgi:hypothetical protein